MVPKNKDPFAGKTMRSRADIEAAKDGLGTELVEQMDKTGKDPNTDIEMSHLAGVFIGLCWVLGSEEGDPQGVMERLNGTVKLIRHIRKLESETN